MRFLVLAKATKETEAAQTPNPEMMAAMGKYNEELIKAGVLLAADGLHPSSNGSRVKFDNGSTTVIDGPFAETKELIAGYWVIDVKSKDEALAWIRRIPFTRGEEVELRKVIEASDFAPDAGAVKR